MLVRGQGTFKRVRCMLPEPIPIDFSSMYNSSIYLYFVPVQDITQNLKFCTYNQIKLPVLQMEQNIPSAKKPLHDPRPQITVGRRKIVR